MDKRKLYVGIDLGYERAMVSLYHAKMEEPETVSTAAGEEKYQIPAAIFAGEQGKYYYGEEAVRRQDHPDGEFYEQLYAEALREEGAFLYRKNLAQYIRRLIRLRENGGYGDWPYTLTVAVPQITPKAVEVLRFVRDELEIPRDRFHIMDYGESFFFHTYHQDRSIWLHDVALFDFAGSRITAFLLRRDTRGLVQMVSPRRKVWEVPGEALSDAEARDRLFSHILRETMAKQIVSGIYLIGDGFDGGWLKESLRAVGSGKRIFLGKNLYTRGAAYAAFSMDREPDWNFYYDCDYKMQGTVGLKLQRGGEPVILPLAETGENWFDAHRELYLLYDGNPALEVRVQRRGERYAGTRFLELGGMPDRPERTVRLRLRALPADGRHLLLQIRDDGFGELFESSEKTWEFPISMDE